MKKGFTLVEIIISISIVLIIGVSITFLVVKKNNNMSKTDRRILEAAKVFAEVEKDENGNSYSSQVLSYAKGIKIPLKTLEKDGYITDKMVNEIYDTFDDELNRPEGEDYYVLLANVGDDYCKDDSTISVYGSWIKEDSPLYLCNTKPLSENFSSLIDKIIYDNGGEENVKELYYSNYDDNDLFDIKEYNYATVNNYFSFNVRSLNSEVVLGYNEILKIQSKDTYSNKDLYNKNYINNIDTNQKVLTIGEDQHNYDIEMKLYYNKYNGLYGGDGYFYRGNITNNYLKVYNSEDDIKNDVFNLYRIVQFYNMYNIMYIYPIIENSKLSNVENVYFDPRMAGCIIDDNLNNDVEVDTNNIIHKFTWFSKYSELGLGDKILEPKSYLGSAWGCNDYDSDGNGEDCSFDESALSGAVPIAVGYDVSSRTHTYFDLYSDCYLSQDYNIDGKNVLVSGKYYQGNMGINNGVFFALDSSATVGLKNNNYLKNFYQINLDDYKFQGGNGTEQNPYILKIK